MGMIFTALATRVDIYQPAHLCHLILLLVKNNQMNLKANSVHPNKDGTDVPSAQDLHLSSVRL